MTLYRYRAVSLLGHVVKGVCEANSYTAFQQTLKKKHLDLINYRKVRNIWPSPIPSVSLEDLILFTTHLSQMASAGIPLLQNLREFSHHQPKFLVLIDSLTHSLESGKLLSQAMSQHESIFDSLYIQFISLGEQTGQFEECLRHLLKHLQWTLSLRDQVAKATRYPSILLLTFLPSMATLICYMVPPFVSFMTTLQLEIPWVTKILHSFSQTIRNHWEMLVMVGVATFFFMKVAFKNWKSFQLILTYIPLIATLSRSLAFMRLFHSLNILCTHKVNLLDALKSSLQLTTHPKLHRHLTLIIQQVRQGYLLSQAMEFSGFFPSSLISMVASGEKSGDLPHSLSNAEKYMKRQVDHHLEHCMAFAEPLLILCMGLFLLMIVYAVFWPLYETLTLVDL